MPPSIVSYGHLVFVVYDLESVVSTRPVIFYSGVWQVTVNQVGRCIFTTKQKKNIDCEITRSWLK